MNKKLHFIFIAFWFLTLQAEGQDYQLFFSSRKYLFEFQSGGFGHFALFKSEAPTIVGTDSVFSNYMHENDDLLYGPPANSITMYSDTTWAGCRVIVKSGGVNILLNRQADSLSFHCNAQVGDTWTFYQFLNGDRFLASLDSISNDSVMGVVDSVKNISIVHIDPLGGLVSDSLNNFVFRISKNYGLLSTLNIRHFPVWTITYVLKGIDSLVGEQGITPASIYDFNVGDVFHYNSYNHISLSVMQWQREKRTILTKTINSNSVDYTILDSLYTQISNLTGVITTLTGSVISESYSTNYYAYDSLCSRLPHYVSPYTFTGGDNYMSSWHRSVNDRRGIYTVPCLEITGTFPPYSVTRNLAGCFGNYCVFPGGSDWFVEGLGLLSHFADMDSTSSIYLCYKSLVFYQKGSETYGTPLSFPLITDVSPLYSQPSSLYPNPANESATIAHLKSNSTIMVYDPLMNVVPVESSYSVDDVIINTQSLVAGLYFICARNDGSEQWFKIVVNH